MGSAFEIVTLHGTCEGDRVCPAVHQVVGEPAYLAGEPGPDPVSLERALRVVRADAAKGVQSRKVHVLTSPLSDYLRFECEWGFAYSGPAGQHTRILDLAERPRPTALVDHDFYLVDDERVLRMHYDGEGHFVGAEEVAAGLLPRYRAARDAAWAEGQPFEQWWAAHPHEHRANRAS